MVFKASYRHQTKAEENGNHGPVAVKGDRIALIDQADLSGSNQVGQVIDAEGMILFPGFIDTHIFQSFLKGLGADHRLILLWAQEFIEMR